jgi:hypothetical protein
MEGEIFMRGDHRCQSRYCQIEVISKIREFGKRSHYLHLAVAPQKIWTVLNGFLKKQQKSGSMKLLLLFVTVRRDDHKKRPDGKSDHCCDETIGKGLPARA